jgi:anaerobic selenocysteine-containing dehydrogenase
MKCKREGARVIAIDPRKSETASQAHRWVPIRLGSDAALALSMAKVIVDEGLYDAGFIDDYTLGFEEFQAYLEPFTPTWAEEKTSIPADQIKDLAREYASTKPAAILLGNGLNMHSNVVQTTRGLALLMALTGNLDIPGGNIFLPKVKQAPCPSVQAGPPGIGREEYPLYPFTPFPSVVDALSPTNASRPRALIVYHANPALDNANGGKVREALASLDLLVVIDLLMTATAQMAHLVLPDTSAWETWGYRVYSSKQGAFVALSPPVMEPVGLSRPVLEVELELASRMGLEMFYPWKDTSEWIDYKLKPANVTFQALKEEHLIYVTPPVRYRKYREKGFATPSGRVEFVSKKYQEVGYSPLPLHKEPGETPNSDYPLLGTTRRPGAYVHTQFRNLPSLRRLEPEARLRIHPLDASPRQIKEGDKVRVESPGGAIYLKATVVKEVQPGLVVIDFGWGNPGDGGENVNRLVSDYPRDSISSTTPNREFICQVWKKRRLISYSQKRRPKK